MIFAALDNSIDWNCNSTWRQSAYNTMWCLIGCSIGDMGTIYYFQVNEIPWSTLSIMLLAMTNGIITSIILETVILLKQMNLKIAGIGAVFEWVAGTKLKAPEWMANIGLEWVLRLVQEPKRLFKRYLVDNTLFVYYFIKQLLSKN